eukprot:RCo001551
MLPEHVTVECVTVGVVEGVSVGSWEKVFVNELLGEHVCVEEMVGDLKRDLVDVWDLDHVSDNVRERVDDQVVEIVTGFVTDLDEVVESVRVRWMLADNVRENEAEGEWVRVKDQVKDDVDEAVNDAVFEWCRVQLMLLVTVGESERLIELVPVTVAETDSESVVVLARVLVDVSDNDSLLVKVEGREEDRLLVSVWE